MKLVACLNFDRPPCTKSRLISTDPADVTEISGRHGRVGWMEEEERQDDKRKCRVDGWKRIWISQEYVGWLWSSTCISMFLFLMRIISSIFHSTNIFDDDTGISIKKTILYIPFTSRVWRQRYINSHFLSWQWRCCLIPRKEKTIAE